MSYNLRNHHADDGENDWPKRLPVIKAMWERVDPDIVGIQEDWPEQHGQLTDWFGEYARLGRGRDADGGGPATSILYKRDVVTCVEHGDLWLSETPDVPGSSSFDAATIRKCTWGRLTDRSGRGWFAVNTHLDHKSAQARERGAAIIRDLVSARAGGDCPVVTGDLNADPESPPLRRLAGDGALVDALARVGATSPTFHRFTGEGRRRIDYILVGPAARVDAAEVVRDHLGAVYPSDHFPICADLHLGDASGR